MYRFFSVLRRIEGSIAVAAYTMTAMLLVADVISREFFSQAIWGAQKIAVFGAITAGILGLSLAVADNAHLRANFADGLLPWPWVDRAGEILSALIFATLGAFSVIFVSESIAFNDIAAVIRVPLWPIQAVFPYAFFSAGLRHLAYAANPALKSAAGQEY